MKTILLSNDDGVNAMGIRVLADSLKDIANIIIVAPDRNRSGSSNSLSLHAPLRVNHLEPNVMSVQGTPTDCVHLAVTGLLDEYPDMVISGINDGANLADDVWYSGTVAAAMEGCFLGIPSLAVSLDGKHCQHYSVACNVVKSVVELLDQSPGLPRRTFFNINIPDVEESALNGIAVTRLGKRHCAQPTIQQTDPRGKKVYWIGLVGDAAEAGAGTDFHAVEQNQVSLTPLKIDLTDYDIFSEVQTWVDAYEK